MKTRLHIICGVCGSNEHLNYSIEENLICNENGTETNGVVISCENCSSITVLDEVIKNKS